MENSGISTEKKAIDKRSDRYIGFHCQTVEQKEAFLKIILEDNSSVSSYFIRHIKQVLKQNGNNPKKLHRPRKAVIRFTGRKIKSGSVGGSGR